MSVDMIGWCDSYLLANTGRRYKWHLMESFLPASSFTNIVILYEVNYKQGQSSTKVQNCDSRISVCTFLL